MEEELRALLVTAPAVTALVPATAINWGEIPQGTRPPAIALHLIDNADGMTLQGPDGLWQGRVQIDAYALTFAGATMIARALRDRLHGYKGGGFRLISLAQQRSNQDRGALDRPFWISIDFMTHWRAE